MKHTTTNVLYNLRYSLTYTSCLHLLPSCIAFQTLLQYYDFTHLLMGAKIHKQDFFISFFINASFTGPTTKSLFHFIQILPSFHAMLALTRSKTWETAAEDPAVSASKRHRPPKCLRCVSPAAACSGLML